jgi:hypothetical protein
MSQCGQRANFNGLHWSDGETSERWDAPHSICQRRRVERNFRDVSQSSAEILLHRDYEETDMKNWRTKLISILRMRLTLENWRAKLISLLLATMLWYLIKKNITTTSSPSENPSRAPVTETR